MKEKYCYLPLKIENYEIQSSKLHEGFDGCRIVFLTDLHSNLYGRENQKLLQKIEEAEPDYIMCTGDMIVGRTDCDIHVAMELFAALSKKWDIYYSLGNHEQKLMKYPETCDTTFVEYIDGLKALGVHVLDNESISLKRGQDTISVTGITVDYKYHYKIWRKIKMEAAYVEKLAGECEKDVFQLLLAHNPEHLEAYAGWGADLVLSGHIHGGIMILPWIGGVIAPSYELFPKFDFGIFQEGKCKMVLSRGLGTHTINFRIFNKPEISCITLRKE